MIIAIPTVVNRTIMSDYVLKRLSLIRDEYIRLGNKSIDRGDYFYYDGRLEELYYMTSNSDIQDYIDYLNDLFHSKISK